MNMKMKPARRFAALLPAVLVAGCGGEEEDRYPLVPVSGTVTQNNKPVGGATITFLPDPGNPYNTPGFDSTGPEGNYKLKFRNRSGVAPGKYKVTVEPSAAVDAARIPDQFKDDPYMGQMSLGVTRPAEKKAAGTKNEFEAEVDGKGGTFDYDVKGKPTN
jgi:hypothetical protein